MSVSEIKDELHKAIDTIENKEFLEALLTIASSKNQQGDYHLSEDEIRTLEERYERFLKGEEKAISIEELKNKTRGKYGF